MKALITTASKHGSTAEIGEAIGEILIDHGIESELLGPEAVSSLQGYDVAILGSAVYAGHWMKSMRELADPPKPDEDPVEVAAVMETTGARGHAVFAGKIDRSRLGFGERAIVSALKVSEGDFRDWDEIRRWATGIAQELKTKV